MSLRWGYVTETSTPGRQVTLFTQPGELPKEEVQGQLSDTTGDESVLQLALTF